MRPSVETINTMNGTTVQSAAWPVSTTITSPPTAHTWIVSPRRKNTAALSVFSLRMLNKVIDMKPRTLNPNRYGKRLTATPKYCW